MNELRAEKLSKYYGTKQALKEFTYTFTDGVYGLLGPNGAGKSTLMNILTDNLRQNSGEVYFQGQNCRNISKAYRSVIGYVPQQQRLYSGMTLERYLMYMAALKGLPKKMALEQIEQILPMVNLQGERKLKLGGFSGGMRQRALIAQAALGNPKIMILDEPTAGLDPKERIRIRNMISEIAFEKIVIVATHVVPDIEMIAKEVIFLREGEICMSGDVQEMCESIQGKTYYTYSDIDKWQKIAEAYNVSSITREGASVRLKIVSEDIPTVEGETEQAPPTLEDLYLYLYGNLS